MSKLRPRLCHIHRWDHFNGYGFNLHSEKNKSGQYIGKVEANSPAESAGLREKDRIIEINHVAINDETHQQVVQRIKEGVRRNGVLHTDEVILLLVDPKTDQYYKSQSKPITSSDPNVEKLETKTNKKKEEKDDSPVSSDEEDGKSDSLVSPRKTSSPSAPQKPPHYENASNSPDRETSSVNKANSSDDENSEHDNHYISPTTKRSSADYLNEPKKNPTPQATPSKKTEGEFELKMTAAEYLAKIKSEKSRKRDPRSLPPMSMKSKYDYINQL